jgi:hypothetical protein
MTNTKTNTFINVIKNVLKNQKNLVKESEWIQFLKDIESHVLQKDNGIELIQANIVYDDAASKDLQKQALILEINKTSKMGKEIPLVIKFSCHFSDGKLLIKTAYKNQNSSYAHQWRAEDNYTYLLREIDFMSESHEAMKKQYNNYIDFIQHDIDKLLDFADAH